MSKEIHTKKIRIRFLEEGIVENYFKGGDLMEVDDFIELKKVNLNLFANKPYTVLVEAEELTSFSKESREYVASKEYVGLTIAKALYIKSLGQRIVGNFYLHVNKPHIKTKLFTDRTKAIDWLREQYVANKLSDQNKK